MPLFFCEKWKRRAVARSIKENTTTKITKTVFVSHKGVHSLAPLPHAGSCVHAELRTVAVPLIWRLDELDEGT